jgi:hypothetical protein
MGCALLVDGMLLREETCRGHPSGWLAGSSMAAVACSDLECSVGRVLMHMVGPSLDPRAGHWSLHGLAERCLLGEGLSSASSLPVSLLIRGPLPWVCSGLFEKAP